MVNGRFQHSLLKKFTNYGIFVFALHFLLFIFLLYFLKFAEKFAQSGVLYRWVCLKYVPQGGGYRNTCTTESMNTFFIFGVFLLGLLFLPLVYILFAKVMKIPSKYSFLISKVSIVNYFRNLFYLLNISFVVFFSFWQFILSVCIYSGGIADGYRSKCIFIPVRIAFDSFYIISLYISILFLTLFVLLVAKDRIIRRLKSWQSYFFVVNLFFVLILFFEI